MQHTEETEQHGQKYEAVGHAKQSDDQIESEEEDLDELCFS